MITKPLHDLIAALRKELQEYGEMLALLDQQQKLVTARSSDDLLRTVFAIDSQQARIRAARLDREVAQRALAVRLRQPESASFAVLIPRLSREHQPLVQALVNENNALLGRVQQRARQNHLLLSRSVELMQRFISTLFPTELGMTYGEDGTLLTPAGPARRLYEEVG